MTLLLNILWFVLGGFLVSIAYILGGLLLCITIIGIPFGIQCFKLSLLGLAPFTPEPHLWEKLKMLADGTLVRPIDIFDLLLHATPWLLLGLKLTRLATRSNR